MSRQTRSVSVLLLMTAKTSKSQPLFAPSDSLILRCSPSSSSLSDLVSCSAFAKTSLSFSDPAAHGKKIWFSGGIWGGHGLGCFALMPGALLVQLLH